MSFEYKEEYSLPTDFCLNLTDACNCCCRYCAPAGTKILMSDWSQKNIEDIVVGDIVIGCNEINNEKNKHRNIYLTKVLGVMSRQTNELYKITMQDGKEIYLTDNHPVLNGRGKWTEVKNLREKTGMIMSLNYLPENSDKPDIYNLDYIKGYFLAMWLTDGMHNQYDYDSGHIVSIRLAVKDDEIIERMIQYCDILNFDYSIRDFKISEKEGLVKPAIFSSKQKSYNFIENLRLDLINNIEVYKENLNYLTGFAAACYDAEGHIDKDDHTISISNSDELILNIWETALQKLGFQFKRDSAEIKANLPVFRSRLIISKESLKTCKDQLLFFTKLNPAIKRKTYDSILNYHPFFRNVIDKIEKINGNFTVYNFETESHTYIANGLVVHNCFVEQNPHHMTYQVAKDAVDYILSNVKKANKKHGVITFFGGEPTLLWDEIIVPITNYIRGNNFPIYLNMTTNALLLDEERIEFLKANNIPILLSFDGDRETQEYNRPCIDGKSSFDIVKEKIPMILKAFPNTCMRGTIYAPTAKNTFNNYLFAINNGFKRIYLAPDMRHPWTEEQKEDLRIELCKIYSFIQWSFENFNLMPIAFNWIEDPIIEIANHDINILQHNIVDKELHSIMRCGLGTVTASINYKGDIFGCQEQPSRGDNIFYIGNIYNGGIDKNLHTKLLEEYAKPHMRTCENEELCNKCKIASSCKGKSCPSSSWDIFGDFFKSAEINCLTRQWCIENASVLLNNVLPNNEGFKNYVENMVGGLNGQ